MSPPSLERERGATESVYRVSVPTCSRGAGFVERSSVVSRKKMAPERDIQVILVLEIEKYPLLYNYKLPEYSRKDLTDKAWTDIAKKTRFTGMYYL
jgi:hypothetical protein